MARQWRAALGTAVVLSVVSAACATAAPRLKARKGRYSVEVLVDGKRQPVYRHRGESHVLGRRGKRYVLRIRNRSAHRIEAVVTVDGRDVLDGKSAHWRKRGYLVPARGSVDIDGWRLSNRDVAAFRFASVANSYAAKTGSDRHVGVIGVAIFPERQRPVYIAPPAMRDDDWRESEGLGGRSGNRGYRDEAPRKSSPAPAAPAAGEMKSSSGLADRSAAPRRKRARNRPGLGTAFGERRHSAVRHVTFARANATRPATLLGLRYNDRRGLIAMGVDLAQHRRHRQEVSLRRTASPFPAEPTHYATPPSDWRE